MAFVESSNFLSAGENFIKSGEPAKAQSAAVLARELLKQGAASDEFAQRLEALDAVIATTNKTTQWRQKANDEADGALKCVQLSEVSHSCAACLANGCYSCFTASLTS